MKHTMKLCLLSHPIPSLQRGTRVQEKQVSLFQVLLLPEPARDEARRAAWQLAGMYESDTSRQKSLWVAVVD